MKGYVDARWGQVHYRRAGDEGPVVVLYHESPLSSLVFEAALPFLAARGLQAIAFDTPGYGGSDPPTGPKEIPDYAAVLAEAAENLGLDRYAVAGSHTGASLAVQVALQAGPERVWAAVLSGVIVLEPEDRQRYLDTWAPPMAVEADGGHLRAAWERFRRIYGEDTDPRLIHLAATELLATLDRYNWAYNAAFRYDPAPDLPDLPIPVHFLIAEHDGFVESDRTAVELVPRGTITEVPELRGQLPLRVPEVFADEVARFLLASGR